jgi:hypothetical protein
MMGKQTYSSWEKVAKALDAAHLAKAEAACAKASALPRRAPAPVRYTIEPGFERLKKVLAKQQKRREAQKLSVLNTVELRLDMAAPLLESPQGREPT